MSKMSLPDSHLETDFDELVVIANSLNVDIPKVRNRKVLYDRIAKVLNSTDKEPGATATTITTTTSNTFISRPPMTVPIRGGSVRVRTRSSALPQSQLQSTAIRQQTLLTSRSISLSTSISLPLLPTVIHS